MRRRQDQIRPCYDRNLADQEDRVIVDTAEQEPEDRALENQEHEALPPEAEDPGEPPQELENPQEEAVEQGAPDVGARGNRYPVRVRKAPSYLKDFDVTGAE